MPDVISNTGDLIAKVPQETGTSWPLGSQLGAVCPLGLVFKESLRSFKDLMQNEEANVHLSAAYYVPDPMLAVLLTFKKVIDKAGVALPIAS